MGRVPRSLGRRALLREGLLLHGDATAVRTNGRVLPLGRIGDAHSRRAVPLDPKSDPGSSLLSHRPLAQQTQVEQAKRLTVWLPKNIYGRSRSTLGHVNKRSACINLQHVIESTNTHMTQRHGVRVMNADAVLA